LDRFGPIGRISVNWDRLDEGEIERLFEEVFAIFRRMLEPPPA